MNPDTPLSLATIAYSRHRAAAANARAGVITCSGCKAAPQGGDWGWGHCRELRREGFCQKRPRVVFVIVGEG